MDRVLEAQMNDEETQELIQARNDGKKKDLRIRESDGMLMQKGRLYMPNNTDLKKEILDEARVSTYAMHPRGTKMYHTIRPIYYWPGMKSEIAEYVSRCAICQQVKAERKKPFRLMQSLPVPQWKWEDSSLHKQRLITQREGLHSLHLKSMDLDGRIGFSKFPKLRTSKYLHQEVGERVLMGPEIVKETTQNIQVIKSNLKAAHDRQKSLADRHAIDRVYKVGDWVFLKLSPWRGVVQFGKNGKLSARYIGPYQITERVGEVAYRLKLPPELSKVHDVFHVYMLRHYVSDPSHVIPPQPLEINSDLTYDEEPVTILDWKDKVLRNKTVRLVKVLWRNHSVEEAT
ncbi:unnamed protein product [Malus baccata var. baccata]